MSELHKRLQMSRLPPMAPQIPSRGRGVGGPRSRGPSRRDYTPVSWKQYFQRMHDVRADDNTTFRVYESGTEGPVCFLLHGGGFSALTWALLSKHLTGQIHCRCVAVDLRGHGDSISDDDENLSAEQLSCDVGRVIEVLYGEDPPPIILIGHSMGGAIAVHTAHRELVPSLIGLIVIDVVEGTAMEALSSMQSFLLTRPRTFKSVEYAVEWCIRSGQVRNIESAKVSMVGQVKRLSTNETATSELDTDSPVVPGNTIMEEEEEESSQSQTSNQSPDSKTHQSESLPATQVSPNQYTWRLDLSKTEKYWPGWFSGLSNMFLSCPVPKMLLLAGVDRLDKDLMVGQMQGKFQMQVLPLVGHAVHEDAPDKVADVLSTFLIRHKFTSVKDDFEMTFPAC